MTVIGINTVIQPTLKSTAIAACSFASVCSRLGRFSYRIIRMKYFSNPYLIEHFVCNTCNLREWKQEAGPRCWMLAVCRQAQAVPVAKPKLPRGPLQLCDTPLQPKAWIYQTSQVQQRLDPGWKPLTGQSGSCLSLRCHTAAYANT